MKRVGRMGFPASAAIALAASGFAMLALLSLAGGIVAMIIYKDNKDLGYGSWFFAGGIGLYILCKIIRLFILRRVRIVRLGMNSVEVCFADEQYALEFCRLNEYGCNTHRGKKRALPISVNPVG